MWAQNSTVTNKKYDPTTNTTTADINFNIPTKATVGIVLKNTKRTASSTINSGFTNLRLYRPGYPTDGSVIFTTPFLNALSKVSVVRMMDWAVTNTNSIQEWRDRRTPLSAAKPGLIYTGK